MTDTRIPPLPSAAVDFNVLHDAIVAGDSGVLAAAKAVAAGSGEELSFSDGLKGKSKTELLKIVEKEDVVVASDATVPDIVSAIEGKRIADLLGPDAYTVATPAAEPDRGVTPPADAGDSQ